MDRFSDSQKKKSATIDERNMDGNARFKSHDKKFSFGEIHQIITRFQTKAMIKNISVADDIE